MKKYNLTALVALTFIASAGYGMDETGCATLCSALPTSAVSHEETALIVPAGAGATEEIALTAPGGAGASIGVDDGTGGTGEVDFVVTAPLFPTDIEIEDHGQEMKKKFLQAIMKANKWFGENITDPTDVSRKKDIIDVLVMTPETEWNKFRIVTSATKKKPARVEFDSAKINQISVNDGPFSPFHSMGKIADDMNQLKALRDSANYGGICFEALPLFRVNSRIRPSHTTLVFGSGRSGLCETHKETRNPHHYTIDINPDIQPDILTSMNNKTLWDYFSERKFTEIVARSMVIENQVFFMRHVLDFLEPGGVFKTMQCSRRFYFKDGASSPDADLFYGWREATGKPLVDISIRKFLVDYVGFERVEFHAPKEEKSKMFKGIPQLHAYKAGGRDSSGK